MNLNIKSNMMMKSWKIRIGNGFVHPSKHFPKDKSSEIKEMGQITQEYPGYVRVFLFYFLNTTLSRSEVRIPRTRSCLLRVSLLSGMSSVSLGNKRRNQAVMLQAEASFALVTRKHSPCSVSNSFLRRFTFGWVIGKRLLGLNLVRMIYAKAL